MPIDLSYTVQGRGGVAFFWEDNAGHTPWSALQSYNFDLFPGAQDDWRSVTSGSFLLSTPFALAAGQTLTIVADIITAHAFPYYDVGFGLLVSGTQVKAVLFALRPDGINHRGDLGNVPGTAFPPPSPGVQVTKVVGGPFKAILGGIQYGKVNDLSDCSGNCSTLVTSTYLPAAGQYQLLFGMFNVDGSVNDAKPAAIIVQFAGN